MIPVLGVIGLAAAAAALVVRFLPAVNRPLLGIAALSPFLMLGAPAATLVFALTRQWSPAAAAAVVTVAAGAVQLPLLTGRAAPTGGERVRFVTANLLLGRASPAAVIALAREHADVLAVQELTPELADTLCGELGTDFPYRVLRPREHAAGVGLWSRHPITASGTDEQFSRGLVWARLRVAEVDATFISTHMPPPRSAFPTWHAEITRLGPVLQQLPETARVVVGGDFNATIDVHQFRALLRDGYRDGAVQAAAGFTRTHPSHLPMPPLLAVDRILTRESTATSIKAVRLAGSDHRALVATVVLN